MIDIDQEEKQGKVEKSEEEGTTVATILLIEKNNFLQHSTSKEEFKKDLIVDISCRGDFLKLEKLLFSPTFFCSFFSFEEDLLGKNLARLQQDPSTSLSTNKVEKKEEKSSGKSDIFESRASEGEQKMINLSFNFSPKVSGENKPFESNKHDSFIHDNFIAEDLKSSEKNVFSQSEPVDNKISTEPSRQKNPAKKETFFEKVTELKSANFDIETEEVPKKLESKSQKTLFDF